MSKFRKLKDRHTISKKKDREMVLRKIKDEGIGDIPINLPLIWWAIIASFTVPMLKFQCNLQNICDGLVLCSKKCLKSIQGVSGKPHRPQGQCEQFHQIPFGQHRLDQNHLYLISSQLYTLESYLLEPAEMK